MRLLVARRHILLIVACTDDRVKCRPLTTLLVCGLDAGNALKEEVAVGGIGPGHAGVAGVGGGAVDEERGDEHSQGLVGEEHFG